MPPKRKIGKPENAQIYRNGKLENMNWQIGRRKHCHLHPGRIKEHSIGLYVRQRSCQVLHEVKPDEHLE